MLLHSKKLTILGIDTSCDDTAVAIINCQYPATNIQYPRIEILSNIVSSQVKLHAKYGGVYPTLAKREHQRNLVPVLKKTLEKARLLKKSKCQNPNVPEGEQAPYGAGKSSLNVKCQNLEKILEREPILFKNLAQFFKRWQKPKINVIAVTVGPGLEPCLWQGINFAKALACYWNLPIIQVNHIEAHLLANWIGGHAEKNKLPAVGLVVSGGHTELVLIKKVGKYKIIGETLDDAAGECLDKTARVLGLGYPGGPTIAKSASQLKLKMKNEKLKIRLPRPMLHSQNLDFSFSGLKTAVLYDYKKRSPKVRKSTAYTQAMARDIQQAIIDVLKKKTAQAAAIYNAKTIIMGGGVAANTELRKQLALLSAKLNLKFAVPPLVLCTDNAAMVAVSAFFNIKRTIGWQRVKAQANLKLQRS